MMYIYVNILYICTYPFKIQGHQDNNASKLHMPTSDLSKLAIKKHLTITCIMKPPFCHSKNTTLRSYRKHNYLQ